MRHVFHLCSLLLLLAGCGLTSTVDEIPLNEAELGGGVLDAVNALVPDGNPMEFEEIIADDDGKIAIAIAPDLWRITTSGVGVEIEPLPGGGADVETVFKIEAICVGLCDKQDWSDYMYNDEFSPFVVGGDVMVLRDEPRTDREGRTLVAERADGGRRILASLWNDDATHFYLCEVLLEPADVALTDAFTAACEGAVPLWLGRP
ncbi:MAG: hypothetical protein KJO17_13930 [Acidimicrobiia bacterium]|nr:hypothetical protein [Acidimicrobiia bacterium]MBT8217946.1 hypothetical protein [Acidimicrobiia bacterium]NNL70297.1 hypothetical protein [Acidimicrobiia bacterium]